MRFNIGEKFEKDFLYNRFYEWFIDKIQTNFVIIASLSLSIIFNFDSMRVSNDSFRVGISMSGGGARGIAHIGVLKALEENDISCSVIAGTSAGAIVGALHASGRTTDDMLQFVKDANIFKYFKFTIPDKGFTKLTYLKQHLSEYIDEDLFEALNMPLYITVSNLNTGQLEVKSKGSLFEVIMASSSIPLVFKPVNIDGHLYVDGGLMQNLPLPKAFQQQSDFIIGVNVMPKKEMLDNNFITVLNVALRCFELSVLGNSHMGIENCDFLVEPLKVHDFNIFQFNKYNDIYQVGYEETCKHIEEIKAAIEEKKSMVVGS